LYPFFLKIGEKNHLPDPGAHIVGFLNALFLPAPYGAREKRGKGMFYPL